MVVSIGKQRKLHYTLWFQALLSRVVILITMAISDGMIPDHNPGDDVARFSASSGAFSTFSKWDSAYYLRLAHIGHYTSPQLLAFYPTYSFMIRFLAEWMTTITSANVSSEQYVVVAAIVVSNASFLLSVVVLRQLIRELFLAPHDDVIPHTAVLSYIWNPGNVFFASAYTESLYALCSFTGMWQLMLANKSPTMMRTSLHTLAASYCFLLASSVRSNGLLNVIFALLFGLSIVVNRPSWLARGVLFVPWIVVTLSTVVPFVVFNGHMHALVCPALGLGVGEGVGMSYAAEHNCATSVSTGVSAMGRGGGVHLCGNSDVDPSSSSWWHSNAVDVALRWLLPGRALFALTAFSQPDARARQVGVGSEGEGAVHLAACCARSPVGCSMYSAVQRQYWEVGVLRYFRWNQVPNFILAAPIVAVAGYTCAVMTTWMRRRRWSRGEATQSPSSSSSSSSSPSSPSSSLSSLSSSVFQAFIHLPWMVVAHVVHLAAVTLLGVLLAHVQISTRLLCSSCPVIYVGFAHLVGGGCESDDQQSTVSSSDRSSDRDCSSNRRNRKSSQSSCSCTDGDTSSSHIATRPQHCTAVAVVAYIALYNVLGVLLHPNFYPWT